MAQSAELSMCDKKGSEISLYCNAGTCETPVWFQHIGATGDLNLTETEDEDELSIRDPDQLVKQYVQGKIDIEIAGEQVIDSDYEGFNFLNAMRSGGESKDVCYLSGSMAEVGNVGWRGKMRNFDRSINGPETGAATQNFRLKPAACVSAACKVRPVKVSTADAITDYDPSVFTPTAE